MKEKKRKKKVSKRIKVIFMMMRDKMDSDLLIMYLIPMKKDFQEVRLETNLLKEKR